MYKRYRALFTAVILTIALGADSRAQEVRETSFRMEGNERVLQQSMVVGRDAKTVWKLISTTEGMERFIAPRVEFELKPGGRWLSSFDPEAILDDTAIHNKVLSYVPERMLSIQIGFPEGIDEDIRRAGTLFAVLMLEPVDARHTRVVETMSGFGNGARWDAVYEMFKAGNAQTLAALAETVRTGKPLNWGGKNPYSGHRHAERTGLSEPATLR